MDNNMIVLFRPFVREQRIMIYNDDDCITEIKVPIEQVVDTINGLKSQYQIDKINLCGNLSFMEKYYKELNTKFSNNIKIEMIEA